MNFTGHGKIHTLSYAGHLSRQVPIGLDPHVRLAVYLILLSTQNPGTQRVKVVWESKGLNRILYPRMSVSEQIPRKNTRLQHDITAMPHTKMVRPLTKLPKLVEAFVATPFNLGVFCK